jgi:undecaprenyl-diphosphatase
VSDLIADVTGPRTDALLLPLDLVGYPGAYVPLALVAAVLLARRGERVGWVLPGAAVGGWVAHRAAKLVYHRPRPRGRPGRRRKKSSSFPSGHTVGATALYGGGALVLRRAGVLDGKPAVAIGVGIPLLMGISRVALHWHWTTDVIGGWLLGGAVALGIASWGSPRTPRGRGR